MALFLWVEPLELVTTWNREGVVQGLKRFFCLLSGALVVGKTM